jgi:hypothetical protein
VWLYQKINKGWVLTQKTEIIDDNLNPNFVNTFKVDFIFETQQELRFHVIDADDPEGHRHDFIGSADTTMSSLFGAAHQTSIFTLRKGKRESGKLIVKVDIQRHSCNYTQL